MGAIKLISTVIINYPNLQSVTYGKKGNKSTSGVFDLFRNYSRFAPATSGTLLSGLVRGDPGNRNLKHEILF